MFSIPKYESVFYVNGLRWSYLAFKSIEGCSHLLDGIAIKGAHEFGGLTFALAICRRIDEYRTICTPMYWKLFLALIAHAPAS